MNGLVLPFTPLGTAVGFEMLPTPYFFWLFLTLVVYFALMQTVKIQYIKRYGRWL